MPETICKIDLCLDEPDWQVLQALNLPCNVSQYMTLIFADIQAAAFFFLHLDKMTLNDDHTIFAKSLKTFPESKVPLLQFSPHP